MRAGDPGDSRSLLIAAGRRLLTRDLPCWRARSPPRSRYGKTGCGEPAFAQHSLHQGLHPQVFEFSLFERQRELGSTGGHQGRVNLWVIERFIDRLPFLVWDSGAVSEVVRLPRKQQNHGRVRSEHAF